MPLFFHIAHYFLLQYHHNSYQDRANDCHHYNKKLLVGSRLDPTKKQHAQKWITAQKSTDMCMFVDVTSWLAEVIVDPIQLEISPA